MFGLFRKKKDGKRNLPPEGPPPPAPGWEAIEKAFGDVPRAASSMVEHHGVHRMNDLRNPPENPLEAVAIYDAVSFWHYVGGRRSRVNVVVVVSRDEEDVGPWSVGGDPERRRVGLAAREERRRQVRARRSTATSRLPHPSG